MSAAPYTASMSVLVDGGLKSFYMAASDVNGQAWTFPDGSTQNSLGASAAVIKDITFSANGTDTKTVSVYVNGIFTGYTIINAANNYAVLSRQVQQTPIGIKPGATVKFVQNS